MSFSYTAYQNELIGKEVDASYLYGNRNWVTSFGRIAKFLSNNRVRLEHADNTFSTRVFRKEWGILTFVPTVGDTVYGTAPRRDDPDVVGQRRFEEPHWAGVVQEVHDGYVIVKMVNTGRLSRRSAIRPRP